MHERIKPSREARGALRLNRKEKLRSLLNLIDKRERLIRCHAFIVWPPEPRALPDEI
jgi:hypothetical protein